MAIHELPVLSIDLDWAPDEVEEDVLPEPPAEEGVLIVRSGSANGWPTYRVTASVEKLVRWVARHYVGISDGNAASLLDAFSYSSFAKVTDAFTPPALTAKSLAASSAHGDWADRPHE